MKLITLLMLLAMLSQFGCSKSNESNKAMERALPEFNSKGVPYYDLRGMYFARVCGGMGSKLDQ